MLLPRLLRLAIALALLAAPALAQDVTLTGTVSYRERIALPPDAQLRVTLVRRSDLSRIAGAEASLPARGGVPIAFALNLRSGVLATGGDYGLLAEISSQHRVLFRSQQPTALVPPFDRPIEIEVRFSPDPPHDPPPDLPLPPAALTEIVWTVTSIGGRPVTGERPLTLSIAPDNRTGGSGGCNNYFTEASIDGTAIAFGPAAATRMACAEAVMAQEQAYFDTLAAVSSYEIDGRSLRLLDAAGVPLIGLVRNEE